MKKILPYLMLLMLVAAPTHAATTYRYSDSVTTVRGDAVGGANVTVYLANTTTKATLYLYQSSLLTTKSNPTYTDGYGRFSFYLLPGTYDITISGANVTTYTIEDVRIFSDTGYTYNVLDYGAIPDDGIDDRAGIQAAVNAAELTIGGVVELPPGLFLTSGEIAAIAPIDSTGITIRGAGRWATRIRATGGGYNIIRYAGSWGGVSDICLDGVSRDSLNTGLFIGPADTTATSKVLNASYNNFSRIFLYKCNNGIVMRPGPYVGGGVGSMYFNVFDDININWCSRGLYLSDGPNASSTGVNRNQFYSVRIGLGTNTGVQIDNGGTNSFYGCSFEQVDTGTSPSATPTAISILQSGPVSGRDNNFNTFFGPMFENCTLDINNANQWTGIIGHNTVGSKINIATGSIPGIILGSNGATVPQYFQYEYWKNDMNDDAFGTAGIFYGTALPDTGLGFPAKRGSMYMALIGSTGKVYIKYGAADTSWAGVLTNP